MNDIITNLKRHCEFLADPKLNGRVPGQEGNRLARAYIQQQFQLIGLTPLFNGNWLQEYKTLASGREVIGVNVGGQIKGLLADHESPSLLIGAHFDHLEGIPGADDNASSVAIMIETARILLQQAKNRSKNIAFLAFDTEERPYYLTKDMGSIRFFNDCPLQNIECVVIMDLCGHDFPIAGREDAIFMMGADSSPTLSNMLPNLTGMDVMPFVINDRYGGDKSDYYVFKKAEIPYVFISAGWWECYHKPCDTLDKLNYRKMAGTCLLILDIVSGLSSAQIKRGSTDTTEIEALSLSKLIGMEVAPERSIMDLIISEIKSKYLRRHD